MYRTGGPAYIISQLTPPFTYLAAMQQLIYILLLPYQASSLKGRGINKFVF